VQLARAKEPRFCWSPPCFIAAFLRRHAPRFIGTYIDDDDTLSPQAERQRDVELMIKRAAGH